MTNGTSAGGRTEDRNEDPRNYSGGWSCPTFPWCKQGDCLGHVDEDEHVRYGERVGRLDLSLIADMTQEPRVQLMAYGDGMRKRIYELMTAGEARRLAAGLVELAALLEEGTKP